MSRTPLNIQPDRPLDARGKPDQLLERKALEAPASEAKNAGIALPINGALQSPIKGVATLDDKQMGDLLANRWYVNIHTAKNPNGEIRGQVTQGY